MYTCTFIWSQFGFPSLSHSNRNLRLELESVHGELERSQAAHQIEIASLTQQLEQEREREREREGVEQSVMEGGGRRVCREGGSGGRGCKRAERLRTKLKSQVEQGNYLRVKLGIYLQ